MDVPGDESATSDFFFFGVLWMKFGLIFLEAFIGVLEVFGMHRTAIGEVLEKTQSLLLCCRSAVIQPLLGNCFFLSSSFSVAFHTLFQLPPLHVSQTKRSTHLNHLPDYSVLSAYCPFSPPSSPPQCSSTSTGVPSCTGLRSGTCEPGDGSTNHNHTHNHNHIKKKKTQVIVL